MEEGALPVTSTTAANKRKCLHHHDRHERIIKIQKAESELARVNEKANDLKDLINRLRKEEDADSEEKLRSSCLKDCWTGCGKV